jgi:hypothetical protein
LNVLAEWLLKASGLGPLLKADRGSGEIVGFGQAGPNSLGPVGITSPVAARID